MKLAVITEFSEAIWIQSKPMVLLVRGKRVSTITFMSVHGILDCKTVTGSVDGELFYNFVQASLLNSSFDAIEWQKPSQCS